MCFFKVKHYFGHISGMVSPIDVKWKGSALVGYWVQYMTLTFGLTHDLDLGCFNVKFQNSSIRNCWPDWCEMKRKWVDMILGWWYDLALWPHPWPWPWSFKVRGWNSSNSEMGRLIDNEWKGCESSMLLTCVIRWGGRMYRIVTGVTSDVGVPSTYLVWNGLSRFTKQWVSVGLHSSTKDVGGGLLKLDGLLVQQSLYTGFTLSTSSKFYFQQNTTIKQ